MLRHLRRDRFAPHLPLEREHREAAFSTGDDGKMMNVTVGVDKEQMYQPPSPAARETLGSISNETHSSTEALLSAESSQRISASPEALDGLIDIAHPSEHVTDILRSSMERAGISIAPAADPGEVLDGWLDEARRKGTLMDAEMISARTEILRSVTDDPEALLTLIRSLERQRLQHEELVTSLEKTTPEGRPLDANAKHGILSRSEAAQGIRSIMRSGEHGPESLQQWIAQATPEEIHHLLDIQEPKSPNALQRGINLLADCSKFFTQGMHRWHTDTGTEPSDKQAIIEQNSYFASVDRTINGLKSMLKRRLEEKANALAKRIELDMLRGLASAAGISVSENESADKIREKLYGIAKKDFNSPGGRIAQQFESKNGVTIEDATEEMNGFVARWKRSKRLQIHAPDFLAKASSLLTGMEECDVLAMPDLWRQSIVDAQKRHDTVRAWIPEFQKAYKRIRPQLDDEAAASFIAMTMGAPDGDAVRTRMDELAKVLENPNALERSDLSYVQQSVSRLLPLMEQALSKDFRTAYGLSVTSISTGEFGQETAAVGTLIQTVRKDLAESRIQNSTACRIAGVTQKLTGQLQLAGVTLHHSQTAYASAPDGASGEAMRKSASVQVSLLCTELTNIQQALTFIRDRIPQDAKETDRNCKGYCDYGDVKIYVNTVRHRVPPPNGPVDTAALAQTKDHEFGHLVVDTLTEHFPVFTGMFEEQERALQEIAVKRMGLQDGSKLENLLEIAAQSWSLDREKIMSDGRKVDGSADGGEKYYRRKRWEELLMQYADYRRAYEQDAEYSLQKDTSLNQSTKTLFTLLDEQRGTVTTDPSGLTVREKLLASRDAVAFRNREDPTNDDLESEHSTKEALAAASAADVKEFDPLASLKKYRSLLLKIREFMHTYPEAESALGPTYNIAKSNYEQLFHMFNTGKDDSVNPPADLDPFTNVLFKSRLEKALQGLEEIDAKIKSIDGESLRNVNTLTPTNKDLWLRLTTDVQWLSIMDYWTMAKESWEDLSRLWKRRGENARGKVGEMLTGWIGDKVPYLGQLKHEFHRRQQSSEQDAVGVWEKALENVDSYALIEQIPHVNNQDHLKALINLLTKRGRLDWDNKELWMSLSRYSHFSIPTHECHRDPILLDKYLQRVIADIWNDKDLYRTWKTGNEHQYKTERDKFTGESDFLANRGALASQLEFQLRTFCERPKGAPMPQSVNPHMYENMFLYAMQKGKMKMEEKFYFLVRGLETGLIPFDRLSIINAEISTTSFPFIDYFYGRNNTAAEIKEIAKSITETKNGHPTYTAGVKTTAFLMEEVCKDETARQRVFKVLDRKGDEIDHEDIPLVAAYATFGQLNNFLVPIAGQRQRITTEGIKNAYVGYNTLFKVHGLLAKKRAEDGQQLSPSDVDFLVSRLIAYIHFDNIVIRHASDLANRPGISYETLENETMPSGSGKKPKEFRDKMNHLVDRVIRTYHIGNLIGEDQLNEYLGLNPDGSRNRVQLKRTETDSKKVHGMTGAVYEALSKAVRDNPAGFIEILKEMSTELLNEGDDEDQLTYAKHKDIFDRSKRFARLNGDK